MTIYNKTTLHNIFIKKQAAQAFAEGFINKETLEKISANHPSDLYSPNVFVSVGLGLLTALIVVAATGIFMLLFNFSFESFFMLMAGVGCYACLEIVTGTKKHFNSGVDKVLMFATAQFIAFGLLGFFHASKPEVCVSFVLFLLFSWFAARFVDMVSGCVAVICFLVFVFNAYNLLGQFTIFSFPYLLMIASAIVYLIAQKKTNRQAYLIDYPVFIGVKVVALFAFYLSGNYYVVQSIIQQNYLLNAQSVLSVIGWFFWGWTFAIPVIYLFNGLKKKSRLLIRMGTLLIAGSALTFKHYFHVMSVEAAMTIGGTIILVATYWLMQYLRVGRHGFTYREAANKSRYEDAEAFILSQSMVSSAAPDRDTKFGGGSFGGAGSGSDF